MAYTYFIQNAITGQFYYGSRSAKDAASDLWLRYFTSSVYVKDLIHQYGKNSFNFKILLEHDDYDVCYWYEQILIRDTFKHEKSLNFHLIDPDTGNRKFSRSGVKTSEQTKSKLRYKRTENTKQRMKLAKLRYFSNEKNKSSYRERVQQLFRDGKIKRPFTLKHREQLSENMASKATQTALREGRKIYMDHHPEYVEKLKSNIVSLNQSRAGIPLSQEHKQKISEGAKNRQPITDETRERLSSALKGKPKSEAAKLAFKAAWKKRKEQQLSLRC